MNAQGLRNSASEAMIADASGVVALSLWNKQCQHFTALATAYDQMEGFPVIPLQGVEVQVCKGPEAGDWQKGRVSMDVVVLPESQHK